VLPGGVLHAGLYRQANTASGQVALVTMDPPLEATPRRIVYGIEGGGSNPGGRSLAPTTFVFRSIDERTKTGKRADWKRSDEPRTATWLLDLVHRVCRDAEVRTVCPHGLRATHASLRRIVADEAVAKIGDALGHADHGKTAAAHYVGVAAAVPVLRVLAGGAGA